MLASVAITTYPNSELHTVAPNTVALVGAAFHQRIGAGYQVPGLCAVGSVTVADQVAICICLDPGNIRRFGITGAGIDVKYNACQLFVSIRSYTGSQIGGGFAQVDEAVHHAVGGNGFGAREGSTVPAIILIGHDVGAVGVVINRFSVDRRLHRTVGDRYSGCGILGEISPSMGLGIIHRGCRGKRYLFANIYPIRILIFHRLAIFIHFLNILLKLEFGGKPGIRLLGIVGILPHLFHRIALQFDVGEGVSSVIFCRGFLGLEEAEKRGEQRDGLLIGPSHGFVPGHGMLHHFVFQQLACAVILRKLLPCNGFRPSLCRSHGFQHTACGVAAPIAGTLSRERMVSVAVPGFLVIGFIQQLKGGGYFLAGLAVPDLFDCNGGVVLLPDQFVGDFTLIPVEICIVVVVRERIGFIIRFTG